MPRPSKGARLWLDPKRDQWVIKDGPVRRRTGCAADDREGADQALADYIGEKYQPVQRENRPDQLAVAEVLAAYASEHAPHVEDSQRIGYAVKALAPFWGAKLLSEVRGKTCRDYAHQRGMSDATVRRELGTLSAAINHWHREHGPLDSVPAVTMPPPPPAKERWLTRSEAAMLLAGALGFYHERWCDIETHQEHQRLRRSHAAINRHAARFIVLGLATGTRHTAILGIQWLPNTTGGHVDLQRGVMFRRPAGRAQTNKRQTPVRLGRKILAHLRRWQRIDEEARAEAIAEAAAKGEDATRLFLNVVSYKGGPIQKMRRSWDTAREFAELDAGVTPHILRHTRATWMMQAGIDIWEAAGFLGMSPKILENVYGHHHPDFQSRAAEV